MALSSDDGYIRPGTIVADEPDGPMSAAQLAAHLQGT